jgi:hypothetical protein
MKTIFTFLIALLIIQVAQTQNVGIGTSNPQAKLEINASDKGILIPRVALTNLNSAAPIATPQTSELVYNTATAGTAPNNVTPGYYYWDGSKWIAFGGNGGRDWSLTGNTGTTASTSAIGSAINNNFIGTTDNTSFILATNNLERMRIFSNGQVGINVSSITQDYSSGAAGWRSFEMRGVSGTATTGAGLIQVSTAANDADGTQIGQYSFVDRHNTSNTPNTDRTVAQIVGYSSGATANKRGGDMAFSTKPDGDSWTTERMRILGNGNVGIGTAVPLVRLHVQKGNATAPTWTIQDPDVAIFQNANNNTALQIVSGTNTTNSVLGFSRPNTRNAGTLTYFHDNGINPYLAFTINDARERLRLPWSASDAVLQLRSEAVGNWARIGTNGSPLAVLTDGVNDISGGSPALFVNNNGNAGIGNTDPSTRLDINGSLRIRSAGDAVGNIRFDASQPYITSGGSYIHVKNGFYLYDAAQPSYTEAAFNFRNVILNDGSNFGGNLRVQDNLEVTGNLAFFGMTTNNRGILLEATNTSFSTIRGENDIRFNIGNGAYPGTTWSEVMRVTRSLRVGIGTDNPDHILHVKGSPVRFEKDAHAAGSDNYSLELFSPQGGNAGEISIRFHQSGRFYQQIRCRPGLFRFTAGNNDTGIDIYANGFVNTSDGRVKMEKKNLEYGLNEIMSLKPMRYNQHSYTFENNKLKLLDDSKNEIGLIAQEVYSLIPEAVLKPEDENKDIWAMNYPKLIPVLVNAIQEQQAQIDKLEKENNGLKSVNNTVDKKYNELKAALEKLESYIYSEAKK